MNKARLTRVVKLLREHRDNGVAVRKVTGARWNAGETNTRGESHEERNRHQLGR